MTEVSPDRRRECGTHTRPLFLVRSIVYAGFEEIVFLIGQGHVLDILEHPNQQRYGGQRVFVIQRDNYVYLVPFVEDDRLIVLKTIIPSRKATKQYLEREPDDHET